MKGSEKLKRVTFARTRRAIRKIEEPSIRDDFAEMLHGLEFCLNNRNKPVALKCAHGLAAMAVGLNRTISASVATGILVGLLQDGEQDAIFQSLRWIDWSHGEDCINAQCQEAKGRVCITIEGVGGCGGKKEFQFQWIKGPA